MVCGQLVYALDQLKTQWYMASGPTQDIGPTQDTGPTSRHSGTWPVDQPKTLDQLKTLAQLKTQRYMARGPTRDTGPTQDTMVHGQLAYALDRKSIDHGWTPGHDRVKDCF